MKYKIQGFTQKKIIKLEKDRNIMENNLQKIVELYFSGYTVKKAVQKVIKLESKKR